MIIRKEEPPRKNLLSMSPMIDVVFLLLVFFVMTFKIVPLEGDFDVHMPASEGMVEPVETLPIVLTVSATPSGDLARLQIGDHSLRNFTEVNAFVSDMVERQYSGGGDIDDLSVTLICDSGLEYRYVIDAMTAVSGSRDTSGRVTPLIQNISFVTKAKSAVQ